MKRIIIIGAGFAVLWAVKGESQELFTELILFIRSEINF